MKLLETYNNPIVDFAICYKSGRYRKCQGDNKLGCVGVFVDKGLWINVNGYKRVPRKINTQQDNLG